jgi:hypothetical protein
MEKFVIFFLLLNMQGQAQFSASDILEKSIKAHDPKNKWEKLNADFNMSIVREGASDRYFTIGMNLPKKHFIYEVKNDTAHYSQGFKGSDFFISMNGKNEVTEGEIMKYQLTKERTQSLKEIYEYLLLLPMRLKKDLKFLSNQYEEVVFNQKDCYKITFKYEPINENETWFFFIDKKTYILQGYQFYLKDINSDGEFITLGDNEYVKGILMAKTKMWYWNKDKSFFRTDRVLSFK